MKTEHTFEQIAQILRYDHETGNLYRLKRSSAKFPNGNLAGTKTSYGYIRVRIENMYYMAHRIAWLLHFGAWPNCQIDHINGDRSDNRICNLRDIEQAVNIQNQTKAQAGNKSGFLGVSPHNGRWLAQISIGRRKKYIGMFDTPELAHAAYVNTKRAVHDGCTL
jgi:hypothetical protein